MTSAELRDMLRKKQERTQALRDVLRGWSMSDLRDALVDGLRREDLVELLLDQGTLDEVEEDLLRAAGRLDEHGEVRPAPGTEPTEDA